MNKRRFAHWTYYESPVGWISISGNGSVSEIAFMDEAPTQFYTPAPAYLEEAVHQLDEYFHKKRTTFDLSLDLREGTEFQRNVWNHLLDIPFGHTTSYLKIADKVGDRKAVRAVGGAVGQNPIAIVVPCHRVVGSNGDLTGFAGGLHRKEFLLALENPEQFGKQENLFW